MLMTRYAQCWRRLKYATVYSFEQLLKDKKKPSEQLFLVKYFRKVYNKTYFGAEKAPR